MKVDITPLFKTILFTKVAPLSNTGLFTKVALFLAQVYLRIFYYSLHMFIYRGCTNSGTGLFTKFSPLSNTGLFTKVPPLSNTCLFTKVSPLSKKG